MKLRGNKRENGTIKLYPFFVYLYIFTNNFAASSKANPFQGLFVAIVGTIYFNYNKKKIFVSVIL